jgi:hypothetical protein
MSQSRTGSVRNLQYNLRNNRNRFYNDTTPVPWRTIRTGSFHQLQMTHQWVFEAWQGWERAHPPEYVVLSGSERFPLQFQFSSSGSER